MHDAKQGRRAPLAVILAAALAVAFTAELKVYPFGTAFRFGLGVVTFSFSLLYFPRLPFLLTGLVTSVTVLLFRVGVGLVWDPPGNLLELLTLHLPGSLYYLVLALIFRVGRLDLLRERPFPLAFLLTAGDLLSNVVEVALRRGEFRFLPEVGVTLLGVALVRSVLVLGVFLILKEEERARNRELEERRYAELLQLVTGLSTETFFLNKSSAEIEETVARAYGLYRRLADEGLGEQADEALGIARDLHEVKKDYQRILAGLERVEQGAGPDASLPWRELVQLTFDSHRRYAAKLGRQVEFRVEGEDLRVERNLRYLLTILNNLLTNAVEAIEAEGRVEVLLRRQAGPAGKGENWLLQVSDNGGGISREEERLIFEPGYTTKFEPASGRSSTGLGLYQVKNLAEAMGGRVEVQSEPGRGTTVSVTLPRRALEDGVDGKGGNDGGAGPVLSRG